jgi:ribosomal protein S18 acetylase RimI-like enzyme
VLELLQVESGERIAQTRQLFVEYARSLGFDLCFQGFDQELEELPWEYAPPDGRLILATWDGEAAGCVALRKLEEGICEMKRLYVRTELRGKGIGRALSEAVVEEARAMGYHAMRLDTIASMVEALGIYRSQGFVEIEPYRYNPIHDCVYLELAL